MAVLDFLFGALPFSSAKPADTPALAPSGSPAFGAVAAASAGDLYPALFGSGGLSSESALALSAVHRAVSLITGAIGAMPLDVKERRGAARLDAEAHWAHSLLKRRPNSWQTPQQWKRNIATHLLLRGNAYCLKVTSGRRVTQLIPLNPDRIRVEQDKDWNVIYHYTTNASGIVVLTAADILHFVGLSLNGVTGVSVLSAAAQSIRHAKSLQNYGISVMESGARFGGAIKHPKTLGDESQARLVASLEKFRGSANAGKLLVLEEGMDFTPLSMTLDDAQFIETAAASRLELYQFFGIPPFLAGDTEKSTSWGSGIEAMNQAFVDYTLNDWLVTIEDTINTHLLPDPNLFCQFNRNSLVRGNIETRFKAYAIARTHEFMTVDEIRAFEDLNPLPATAAPTLPNGGEK